MRYRYVTVGGTFDHFHKGHQAMLERAFAVGEQVWLGVTSDAFISTHPTKTANGKRRFELIAVRKQQVTQYLDDHGWLNRTTLLPLEDKFGSTTSDERLQALIVSPETAAVATEINQLRSQKSWSALSIELVPWVLADDGQPINSVRIREGEIDRNGALFRLPVDWGVRQLPEKLRATLKLPLGELILDNPKNHSEGVTQLLLRHPELVSGSHAKSKEMPKLVRHDNSLFAVGDAVTHALVNQGVFPDISIVDLKIARQPVYKNVSELGLRGIKILKQVKNAAGTLSFTSYTTLLSLMLNEAKPAVLQIEGEDDLLALMALFLAPLDSLIVYGQPAFAQATKGTPNCGIVIVEATEENKQLAKSFLNQFTPVPVPPSLRFKLGLAGRRSGSEMTICWRQVKSYKIAPCKIPKPVF